MSDIKKTLPPDAVPVLARAFLDEGAHRASLPLLAELVRGSGRPHEALMLVDRYHRTGPDTAGSRLTEALARMRLAGMEEGLHALRRAALLDPTDPAAARALLGALVRRGRRHEAAAALDAALPFLADPRDAVALLDLGRPGWQSHGVCERQAGAVAGWVAWTGGGARRDIVIEIGGRELRFHAVAGDRTATARIGRFAVPCPPSTGPVHVRDALTGVPLAGSPLVDDTAFDAAGAALPDDGAVTVIVPVHGDAAATARCLDSVLGAGCTVSHRVLVVDDASPVPAIRRRLDALAHEGRIVLLRNAVNLGFVRAVNRGLRLVPHGDVVLLNADTVVPPGWLDRLAAVAAAEGVGTVTPLSNNGELVSIPRPFRANPMPSAAEVAAIDRRLAAAASQAGLPASLPMPNGVGFCLYVTAAARAAAGLLDAARYRRGYLEEVDYSLRVREAGLLNLCATGVYVGHEGSVSFGEEKRALVRLNARALARRWPSIHAETDAFVAADPLRPLRLRREWLACTEPRPGIVVSRRHADLLRALVAGEGPALLLSPGDDGRLEAQTDPGMPWTPLEGGADLAEDLAGAGVRRLVFADWMGLSGPALQRLLDTGLPHELFVFDAAPLEAPRRPGIVGPLAARLVAEAKVILCPGAAAERAMVTAWPAQQPRLVRREAAPAPAFRRSIPANPDHVGVLVADDSRDTHAMLAALARSLAARRARQRLVVIGTTADDIGLLRGKGVFVTGAAEDAASVLAAIDTHACASLLLAIREPYFAHPAFDAVRAAALPTAGWSLGAAGEALAAVHGSVVLPSRAGPDDIAAALVGQAAPRDVAARVA